MPLPNSSFSDIIATTLQGYSGKLADNVSKSNAILNKMEKKGKRMPATGRSIVQELEYAENSTTQWYSGSELLDVSASDTFTAAEFNYKQLSGNIVIDGLEQIQNSGKEAIHNLVKSRINNLDKSLRNSVTAAIYSDGTGSSGKEIGGLKSLVSDLGTGTVGGIDSSVQTWWKSKIYDFSANSATGSSTTIQAAMNSLYIDCTRGTDKPDLIVTDKTYYIFYQTSLQANQRFTDEETASAGFMNLMFMGAPVVYDEQCTASRMYFLNTDYLFLRPAKDREFVPMGEKSSVNQDALVMPVVWAGNMTCSNRALQGVILP
jgi:hypothetical protein